MPGNLLIVDDELDVLEGLVELYETELNDVSVYKANNARKALAFLQIIRFDVVVTDINMPGMNGLELFKQIRRSWPKCRVVFLTGYRDFDYLYEINKHKDVKFMLKSESDEVLVEIVKEAFDSLELMLTEKVNEDLVEVNKSRHLDYYRERVVRFLEDEDLTNSNVMIDLSSSFGFKETQPFTIFLLHLDEKNEQKIWGLETEIQLLCEEFFPEDTRHCLLLFGDNDALILVQAIAFEDDVQYYHRYINLLGAMNYVQEKMNSAYQVSVSMIASSNIKLMNIKSEFQQLRMLSYRYLRKQKQSIIRKDIVDVEFSQDFEVKEELYQLSIGIESNQKERFDERMDRILDIIFGYSAEEVVKEIYQGSMGILLNYMLKKQIIDRDLELFHPYTNRFEAIRHLIRRAHRIKGIDDKNEGNRNEDIIKKIKEYVQSNIKGDLSLDNLAAFCYLNPSYLSRIFKQSTGQNLSEYVSQVRIDYAKKMLLNSQLKINEIAEKIGYQTPHSFTRLFKKMEGVTPLEYRERFGHYG